jgi:mannose-6-phosphate isomerase-like protein (cupin superfamily)
MTVIYREERPWGWFETLHRETQLQIKKIMVHPGKRLSYQSHEKRSENWTVIKGNALVVLDGEDHQLSIHQMIFIPVGAKHRIQNVGREELIFIEVQTGDYLGEDDIVRYADDFNRT